MCSEDILDVPGIGVTFLGVTCSFHLRHLARGSGHTDEGNKSPPSWNINH